VCYADAAPAHLHTLSDRETCVCVRGRCVCVWCKRRVSVRDVCVGETCVCERDMFVCERDMCVWERCVCAREMWVCAVRCVCVKMREVCRAKMLLQHICMRALVVCARERHARERAKERESERDRGRESEREKETDRKSERAGETDTPEKERHALEKKTQRTAYLRMWYICI